MSSSMGVTNDSTGVHAEIFEHSIPSLPPPPDPSEDPHLLQGIKSPSPDESADPDDIFKISATTAMEHLAAGLEALVQITGDVPPTPPPQTESETNMREMQKEKLSIVRSYSEKSLARLREQAEREQAERDNNNVGPVTVEAQGQGEEENQRPATPGDEDDADGDGITMKSRPNSKGKPKPKPEPSSSSSSSSSSKPYVVIGSDSQPLNTQHAVLTRKFYSKTPPPISIPAYLARIHKFCPMSVAVYLATSLYIHRLAVEERAIAVTRRNVHRLVLAGLRVAMKALEDHSYRHAKLAAVGGVKPKELARLEVGFCFLTGFELAVSGEELGEHWRRLRMGLDLGTGWPAEGEGGVELVIERLKR